MPRMFIGWPIPPELRERIGATAEHLRADLPAASWTRSANYHLTFAFLGEQPESSIAALGDALTEAVGAAPAAGGAIGAAGFFPSSQRPRVGWLGLADKAVLNQIAEAVRSTVRASGIELDDKPFHAHLTLVRLRSRWRPTDVDRFLSAWSDVQGIPLLVDSVILFESQLGAGGAKHVPRVVAKCGTIEGLSS